MVKAPLKFSLTLISRSAIIELGGYIIKIIAPVRVRRKIKEKLKAIELRSKGYSLNEIVEKVGVVKSSVSVWVRNIPLSDKAKRRLLTKIKLGQLISAENKRQRTQKIIDNYRRQAIREVARKNPDKIYKKIMCSLLYWCEGLKDYYKGVYFANSDFRLVKTFLQLFRESFDLDEKRFRACIHLHQYHNPQKQLKFWADITKIPQNQFIKPYLKLNTAKRIREGYQGCIGIKYSDNNIARQLLTTAEALVKKLGGVG